MKKFILALIALFTITVSASAMSYEQARQQALFLTDKMAYELNLTDEQKSKISSIREEYYQKMRALDTEELTEAQHKKEMAKLVKEEIQARDQVLTAQQKTFLKSERNKMK